MTSADALAAAEVVAERVLAPAATEVDRTGSLPPEHLDALARDGLYGIAAPAEHGGVDRATRYRVIEALAAGCLSTTLVWMQHHGVVSAVAASPLTGHVLGDLCSGSLRAGVAIGGIRPGVVPLRVRRVGTDLELTGSVPWLTGWGLVDLVHIAARDEDGGVTWVLADAADLAARSTAAAVPLDLTAVAASRTVTLHLDAHRVPPSRVTAITTYERWQQADVFSLRGNGSLPLGLATRCARIMADPAGVDSAVESARGALDAADARPDPDAQALMTARAAASELALRAAASAVVGDGGRSVLVGSVAERSLREAGLLLVFATRPGIRSVLQDRLRP